MLPVAVQLVKHLKLSGYRFGETGVGGWRQEGGRKVLLEREELRHTVNDLRWKRRKDSEFDARFIYLTVTDVLDLFIGDFLQSA